MGDIIGSTLTSEMMRERNENINTNDINSLGRIKNNPQISTSLGMNLKGLVTKGPNGVYTTNKMRTQPNINDIDGDGISNKHDWDIDGDGIPNKNDSTPNGFPNSFNGGNSDLNDGISINDNF